MMEPPWLINIVVPMAGRGSRFQEAGYQLPKPLIPVHGVPMIRLVIENLRPSTPHRFLFLCLQEHLEKYQVANQLQDWTGGCEVIPVNQVTEGAACTVLLAKALINTNASLMIANSDQWVDINIDDYLETLTNEKADGLIMTMWADDPKWSFIGLDSLGNIDRVVEKEVISNEATVGIYNFAHGSDYVSAAEAMIKKDLRVNNEFYVAPAYNEMIAKSKKIVFHNVGKEAAGMYGMGIPSDLAKFEGLEISRRAISKCL